MCWDFRDSHKKKIQKIKGIEIYGHEHKISQYVDDTTLVLKYDKNNLNRVLDTLKFFHLISGLKVNIEKTKVVQLGSWGGNGMMNLQEGKLELTEEFMLLGIQFNINKLQNINRLKLQFGTSKNEESCEKLEKKKTNSEWKKFSF